MRWGVRLIAISLLGLTGLLAPPRGWAVALSVYGQLPRLEGVAVSPDGSRLAYVRTQGDMRVVFIATVADRKVIRWVKAGETKLRFIQWADDDNLMIVASVTAGMYGYKEEWSILRVYNVQRNELRTLPGDTLGEKNEVMNIVLGVPEVRSVGGHTVLFVPGLYLGAPGDTMTDSENVIALFRCDLKTGLTTLQRRGSSYTQWRLDAQGQLAAERDYDWRSQRWSLGVSRLGGDPAQAASGHAPVDLPDILGFGPTADSVLVESVANGDRLWQLLSVPGGKFSPMPAAQTFDEPLLDELTGRMIGGVNTVDVPQYTFFDPALSRNWQAIVTAFKGDAVTFVSASSDYSKIAVLVDGPNYGYRYMLIDLKHPAALPIGDVYSGLDKPLEVRPITYPAGDGLQIHGYLTLPDRPAHHLALVVLPHGGPAARDTAEFYWWSQALAAQGYAVLQPNFRGSDVDERLLEAGYGQWGRKMQTDLSDGVGYLAKQDIVDPAKVCIVGASYGGYAALAGVTLQPTVYRCAVSVAGISDLVRMLQWETRGGIEDTYVTRYWDRYWGVSGAGDPTLDSISPIKHVDAVTAPVLLIHGRDDTVVPYEQSQIMYDALRSEKKDVELVTLKKEDHWLSGSDTRLQMLQATVAFLQAHDPPN
ncbi:MAG TPA: S9 family peptidase [Steroidobacteraceae bacterium]|nr:S9 family peptidase [Steroidobacteraceae bacterium]